MSAITISAESVVLRESMWQKTAARAPPCTAHISGFALPEIIRSRFIFSDTGCWLWAGELVVGQV